VIDTHCHLLPKLDDGPANPRASLALAAGLSRSGVTLVLCTPHFSSRYPTDQLEALEAEASLMRLLEAEGVELELALAAEISPERAVTADDDDLLARSIAERFLLVELLSDTPAVSVAAICERVETLGLAPILAHPERCRVLRRSFTPLDEARRGGALVQVVATSLLGRWGGDVAAAAWRLVDTGRADLVGSDAHHRGHATVLHDAAGLIESRLGESVRHELVERRPKLVVSGVHPQAVGSA
jgi:protein-tyrosine phosphatase